MNQSRRIETGRLFVLATPIGNLGDISFRAVETLKAVDLVAAEDTRHTGALLTHLGIRKKMLSLHSHNEGLRSEQIMAALQSGDSVALVSDAGTPLISDPGFPLVRAARQQAIPVVPVPGPSALLAALSVSGLPCERFTFEGFLPAKRAGRRKRLEELAHECRTMVFYESPHRIQTMVLDACQLLGEERNAFVARELTKLYEQSVNGSLQTCLEWLDASADHRKGEFVVIIEGDQQPHRPSYDEEKILLTLSDYLSVKDASHAAACILDHPRKALYQRLLTLNKK